MIPPEAIVLLPPEATTIGRVREYVQLDQLQAAHPDHELFAIAFKIIPDNPFAIVMRVRKDVVHIQERGLPIEVDPETRVAVVYPANQVPLGDGRCG